MTNRTYLQSPLKAVTVAAAIFLVASASAYAQPGSPRNLPYDLDCVGIASAANGQKQAWSDRFRIATNSVYCDRDCKVPNWPAAVYPTSISLGMGAHGGGGSIMIERSSAHFTGNLATGERVEGDCTPREFTPIPGPLF